MACENRFNSDVLNIPTCSSLLLNKLEIANLACRFLFAIGFLGLFKILAATPNSTRNRIFSIIRQCIAVTTFSFDTHKYADEMQLLFKFHTDRTVNIAVTQAKIFLQSCC